MATLLGVDTPEEAQPVAASTGFEMTIKGTDLVIGLDGRQEVVGTIENHKVSWEAPTGPDTTRYLPYAKEIAAFITSKGLNAEAFPPFMARYFGIVFTNGAWKPLEDGAEHVDLSDGLSLWTLRGPNNSDLCIEFSGQTLPKDGSAGSDSEPRRWRLMEPILSLDPEGRVMAISQAFEKFLRFGKERGTNGHANWNGSDTTADAGGTPTDKMFQALADSGFDIKAYMAQHGLEFSPRFHGSVDYLGLLRNQENGKVGLTIPDVLAPKGEFAGLQVACYEARYSDPTYYLADGSGWKVAFSFDAEERHRGRTRVKAMSRSLSPEQRLAVRAFLAKQEMSIPKKFASFLTVEKPRKAAKA